MALFSRLRTIPNRNSIKHCNLGTLSILSPVNQERIIREKKRAALTLLKSESNPERIIEICRAASLSTDFVLDRIAFSVAIAKLSQANHFDGIAQFLEELKTRPDLQQNQRFIDHSIILYGKANMIGHAKRAFKEMDKQGLRHSVRSLNALLQACNLSKEYEEAKWIFHEFPKTYGIEPILETYNAVIKACCESGDSSSVYSILADMDRKSIKPNTTSFGFLLAGFYKEEKYEDVSRVLQMMGKYGIESGVSMNNIRIKSLCKLKRSAEAKSLFEGMLSRGTKPNLETYNHLIHGFCKEGNLKEAKSLFRIMIRRGCKPDSSFYFSFMYFLCDGGDYEAALKVCKECLEKGWVPPFSNMKSLVIGLVSISKVAEAKKLVRVVKEKFPIDADMWNKIETGLPQE